MTGIAVYGAINAVSLSLSQDGISKSRKNQQQGYAFRGIDEVMNALAPLLAKHKLIIAPRILDRNITERSTQKGTALFYVVVTAEFDFISAADGSKMTVRTYGEAMDSADKATNKAMSAAYKYAAFQTFCIPTEGSGDDDADATTHEVAARPSLSQPKKQEPTEQAGKPDAQHVKTNAPSETAGSVTPASSRKTVDDIPTVAPTSEPVPHQGAFAPEPKVYRQAESYRVADQLIAALRVNKTALRKDGSNLDDTLSAHVKWKTDAQNQWGDMVGIDQRRVKKEREAFEAILARAGAGA